MTIQASGGRSGFNRRTLLTGTAALAAAAGLTHPRHVFSHLLTPSVDGAELRAKVPPGGGMAPGSAAYVECPPEHVMLFRGGQSRRLEHDRYRSVHRSCSTIAYASMLTEQVSPSDAVML